MSCIFTPFKLRLRRDSLQLNDSGASSAELQLRKHKKKRPSRRESSNVNMNTNAESGTNSHSHSQKTQNTQNTHLHSGTCASKGTEVVMTPLEGIPFEIGGHTFDTSDEVSIISFSTLWGASAFDANEMNKVQQMNERWGALNNNHNNSSNPKKTKPLREYKDENQHDEDQSISEFTRISI